MSCKFSLYAIVRHQKTDGIYRIVYTPGSTMIMDTDQPAYGYRKFDSMKKECVGPLFVRSQTQMEDGRFVELNSRHFVG